MSLLEHTKLASLSKHTAFYFPPQGSYTIGILSIPQSLNNPPPPPPREHPAHPRSWNESFFYTHILLMLGSLNQAHRIISLQHSALLFPKVLLQFIYFFSMNSLIPFWTPSSMNLHEDDKRDYVLPWILVFTTIDSGLALWSCSVLIAEL